jgi:hypothetical protein
MDYIDQNPVVVGLAATPEDWKASAAYYKKRGISSLVDFSCNDNLKELLFLPQIPFSVSKLIPPSQLEHIQHYMGVYTVALDRLYYLLPKIPNIDKTEKKSKPPIYLHYYTQTHNYYILGYDGDNTFYGKVHSSIYPHETCYQTFELSNLLKNPFLKLEMVTVTTK